MTQDPPGLGERRSIANNAVLSLVTQVSGALFTAGLTIFLTRTLGTHGYGVLSLALGLFGLALTPSDFGISYSLQRFVADHHGERSRVAAVVADGLRLKLAAGVVVAALLFGLASPIAAAYHLPALAWPIRAIAIAVFGQSMMMTNTVFVSLGRTDLQFRTIFTESAVQCAAALGLVLAGGGVTGAAFGWAIGFVAGAALTVILLVRFLGSAALPRSARLGAEARRIGRYAGILLVVDGTFMIFNQVDILIIGAYLGAGSVGIFSAPLQFLGFLAYPSTAIASGVAPRLSRFAPGGPNVSAFVLAVRLMFIIQSALSAFVLGWAGLMVHVVLGDKYAASIGVLRALAPFAFLNGFGALVSVSANFLGEASRRVPVAIVTVLINIGLDLLLVPRVGVIGGAIGTDAAYLLYAPAHLYICQRVLRIDLRPAVVTFVRTALAGVLMTGVLFLFGDSIAFGQLPRTILGGALALALFVLVLYLSDEVSGEELRMLRSAVRLNR